MSFTFKSSGIQTTSNQTSTQSIFQEPEKTLPPIGIKTPINLGNPEKEGIFEMHFDLFDQISDNLRNLITTNWGERIGRYDYGANLGPLTTDLVSQDDFDNEAITRINNAIKKWMSFVRPVSFVSKINNTDNKNTAVIELTLTYKVPSISDNEKKLLVTLYAV
jgi:phage baseplate assembly protein W